MANAQFGVKVTEEINLGRCPHRQPKQTHKTYIQSTPAVARSILFSTTDVRKGESTYHYQKKQARAVTPVPHSTSTCNLSSSIFLQTGQLPFVTNSCTMHLSQHHRISRVIPRTICRTKSKCVPGTKDMAAHSCHRRDTIVLQADPAMPRDRRGGLCRRHQAGKLRLRREVLRWDSPLRVRVRARVVLVVRRN